MKSLMTAAAAALALSAGASAQMWSAEQAEVWSAVEAAWEAHVEDGTWHEVLHENGYGWGSGLFPVARDGEAMRRAAEAFADDEGEVLHYDLAPIQIARAGDTAIAFYYIETTSTDYEGERQYEVEKCADTLIKDGDDWVFLGWGCQTLESDD